MWMLQLKYAVNRSRFARQLAWNKSDLGGFLPRTEQLLIDVAGDHRHIAEMHHAFEKTFGNCALTGDARESELRQPLRRNGIEQRVIMRLTVEHFFRGERTLN